MPRRRTASPGTGLDRLLNLFAEVRPGESVTVLLLTVNVFLILTAYYIMKPVREALILGGGGAELKSYMSAGQTFLLLFTVPLYARLVGRFSRRRLINGVTVFFALCIGAFWFLARAGVPLGVVFFLWVGIFNVSVIAQFWSFANDLYTPEAGKRLFAIVGFGASSGAVFGPFIAGRLIGPMGEFNLLLVAGAILLLSLVLTNAVDSRERAAAAGGTASRGLHGAGACGELPGDGEGGAGEDGAAAAAPIGRGDVYRLVFRNRYLLLIALLILFLNWVNTTGEYILGRVVSEAAVRAVAAHPGLREGVYIGKFYSDFFLVVNIAGLGIQLFLVSRILKYLGVRAALLILPLVALVGYAFVIFVPVLGLIRWTKTAENATDYSLQNTLRGVLFLPTTREEKYKAKQAIDTIFVRGGGRALRAPGLRRDDVSLLRDSAVRGGQSRLRCRLDRARRGDGAALPATDRREFASPLIAAAIAARSCGRAGARRGRAGRRDAARRETPPM